MATPLRPRREDPAAQRWAGAGGRAAAPPAAATSWPGRGGRPAAATHHLPARAARCLDQEPQAEPRGKAVLLSGPRAEALLPSELLSALVLGLDVSVPYYWGMTGTVRDITQTRVSHHSEPAKIEADNG